MILLRGIRGEAYARKIRQGIVDCRDVLSTLLDPPVTGYAYSDYYEKNLVKALTDLNGRPAEDFRKPDFLCALLTDHYIPHIYLTYFHILNDHSLEWLEKFEDDHRFIALDVRLDRITGTAIGSEYFGSRMTYADSIRQLDQQGFHGFNAACLCSLEGLFPDKKELRVPLRVYNTLAFALLCRERDERFTDLENEFRIMAYDCPRLVNGQFVQLPRKATITGKSGAVYRGVLTPGLNTFFKGQAPLARPEKRLREILSAEKGQVTLDSSFKSIDIRPIAGAYRYVGGKKACAGFIQKMLDHRPPDLYADWTVRKKYRLDELPNARFTPGHMNVTY